MSAQETITKLIEKYDAKSKHAQEFIDGSFSDGVLVLLNQHEYYHAKKNAYDGFISDLKQLQQNTGD